MVIQNNDHIALIFPGIGVRPFGKEQVFCNRYMAQMAPFLERGGFQAGVNLLRALDDGEIPQLDQLAREIFAFSFSCGTYEVLCTKGIQPKVVAGHSLGVYAALTSADVISFEDGLDIIIKANQLGRNLCGRGRFGVGVIIGIAAEEIRTWLDQEGLSSICLANYNSPSSGVYAGYRDEVDRLMQWAEETGAIKVIRLRIDIPFHTPFMHQASAELKIFLQGLSWSTPRCPVLSALDHTLLTEQNELLAMTAANLSATIDWPGVILKLSKMGFPQVVECGAGLSLTQHGRFIDSAPRHYNLKNLRRRLGY